MNDLRGREAPGLGGHGGPGGPQGDGAPGPAGRIGLAAGLVLAALPFVLTRPESLGPEAWHTLGLGLLMAVWWVTGAAPLAATALVPLAVFPFAGIAPLADTATAYAHPLVILFLGGFLLARGLERWNVHWALASGLLGLVGGGARRIVGALMLSAAFLSLWISNTAATMIMAPIGAAVAAARPEDDRFAAAALLGIAYAATIGGMGSLIGTPPNALLAAYASDTYGVTIGFVEWAAVGIPVVLVLLPIAWIVLTRIAFSIAPGPMPAPGPAGPALSRGGRRVAAVAGLAALALLARPLLERALPESGITDAGILLLGGTLLFVLPSGEGRRLLDWEGAKTIRWDVLILFGGGIALAQAIDRTGLAAWIASGADALAGLPLVAIVLVIAAGIVLVGELASNTAMAAIFLPVAGAIAAGLGAEPLAMLLPVALAASIGFMLPVATPPNAIVFAHPAVTRARMLRAGALLDVIGVLVAVGVAWALAPLVFGA